MKSIKMFVLAMLATATAGAADNINTDLAKDIHLNQTACPYLQTDMVKTNFSIQENDIVVTMTMSRDVTKSRGYREYYFWVDVDPVRKKGYQPYSPHSVAWPDMYADYRFFVSMNDGINTPYVKSQNCSTTDCAEDAGLNYTPAAKFEVSGPNVIFTLPKSQFPALAAAKSMKVGYTTYFDIGACNGEDDSPQWGRNAWTVENPGAVKLPPVPKAD